MPILNDFNGTLEDKLLECNFEIIGRFSCRGYTTYGPFKLVGGKNNGRPNKEDLENARNFAESVRGAL